MSNFFSKNLKYLIEKKRIEQQKMADDLNIPRSTLSCWVNGIRTPKIEQIQEIVNYLNVDIDIISRDYSVENQQIKPSNELDNLLFSKAKDLSDSDKKAVLGVIEALKKDVDNELDK